MLMGIFNYDSDISIDGVNFVTTNLITNFYIL
jgi:hypothetical protein